MNDYTKAINALPGLRSENRRVQAFAVAYYVIVALVVLGGMIGGGLREAITSILVGVFLMLPPIAYAKRASLPLVGGETRGQKALGWILAGLAWLAMINILPSSGSGASTPADTPEPTAVVTDAVEPTTTVDATATKAVATKRATGTPRPTKAPSATSLVPTATATRLTTATPVPPTLTLVPPTLTPVPPTAAPPVDLDPTVDRSCDDFDNYDQMVAWRKYWQARGIPNPGRLDGDGDGVACEEGEGGRPAPAAPPPAPAQGIISPPEQPAAPAPRACCKHCTPGKSKACGDSCIRISYNCNKGPGCACDG